VKFRIPRGLSLRRNGHDVVVGHDVRHGLGDAGRRGAVLDCLSQCELADAPGKVGASTPPHYPHPAACR
jgi:hypothetical protein